MNTVWVLTAAIFAPLLCGMATLLLPRRAIGARVLLALAGPIAALTLLGWHVAVHGTSTGPVGVAWMPMVKLDLAFHADNLGLFFAFLVSGIGLGITLYARAYFGPAKDDLYRFYPSLHLFMTAMIGVALADSFMLLLLFWEMTSISSFLLIGWERDDPSAVRKAMQAFIVTALGGLAMMGGLILMGVHTGAWTFSALLPLAEHGGLVTGPVLTWAFVLIFIGAAAKSAQWPFHFWLPGAMAAPTPVSAYLHSATMVKAGVYLTGRLWPLLAVAVPLWPSLIVPIGALTMVYGAFVALQKHDLKQIFAYTTVSQLGLLMCMYGLAAFDYGGHGAEHAGVLIASAASAIRPHANLIWDVTQILNHALYKAPLFILAGAIGHVASRQLPELRGLFHRGRTQRIMAVVMVMAAYALAAGPLTVSFTAKEMFFYQIVHALEATQNPWFWALVAAGIATGMFNVAIFLRIAATLLRRDPAAHANAHHDAHAGHGHDDQPHETGFWPAFLWIPGAAIVAFQFIGGTIPGAWEKLFGWLEATPYYFTHFPLVWDAHPGLPLYMSLAAIGLGVVLALSPLLRRVFADPHDHLYPGFYKLCTQGGGRAFGLVQRGHAGFYLGAVAVALIGLFAWAVTRFPTTLAWPQDAAWEPFGELLPGYLLTALVCFGALLMPLVADRAARVLVLGTVGFSVTGIYYLYQAPDLALTQISIEIVSLILFLLVLSMLPRHIPGPPRWVPARILIAVGVGGVMFWLTLTSSVGPQPTMPYLRADGRPIANLGEFFLRNSHHGMDAAAWTTPTGVGVVDRVIHHTPHTNQHNGQHPGAGARPLHAGGGGDNVVNVILVDGRGFDTMGEITVLGLAALGVWTLLRRPRRADGATAQDHHGQGGVSEPRGGDGRRGAHLNIDIPAPTGGDEDRHRKHPVVRRSVTA